jgi:hypothetical protein
MGRKSTENGRDRRSSSLRRSNVSSMLRVEFGGIVSALGVIELQPQLVRKPVIVASLSDGFEISSFQRKSLSTKTVPKSRCDGSTTRGIFAFVAV